MRRPTIAVLSTAAALCLSSVGLASTAWAAPSDTGLAHRNTPVCADAPAGAASCDAIRRDTVDRNGRPVTPAITPSRYGPSDIRAAYGLKSATGGGKTVAIVDAYDAPSAEADLGTYRTQFGLPACTTANGCFRKVNQTGGSTPPQADPGWAQEISLDLDMVSATCPDCHILLVEARSASFADLAAAVNTAAATPGVVAISNSYGGTDQRALAAHDHPGIAITASTGDGGYEVESPASFPTVIAVGGTSLSRAGTSFTEKAWSGAGSGCSLSNSKPSYQTAATACAGKATADVSAVADPRTGVAVYDSYAYQGTKGWMVFGGTSASAPLVASVYAMGSAVGSVAYPASKTWANAAALRDVTSGTNGTCTPAVWCTARTG